MTSWSTVDTEFGPFSAVVAEDGAVLGSGWTADPDEVTALIAPELLPERPREVSDLGAVTRAILAYHRGELDAIDTIPVRQRAGPFLGHAREVLRKVPPGEPVSYTEFAALAGRPKAVRAAASACAGNAAALFVPCHRVVRGDRSPGGFRWGTEVKDRLLRHERR